MTGTPLGHPRNAATIEINGFSLKAIRERSGFDQARFADEAGISRPYLSNIERGARVRVRPHVLNSLLRVLVIEDRRALLSNPHAHPAGEAVGVTLSDREPPSDRSAPVVGHSCDTCPTNRKIGLRNLRALQVALRDTDLYFRTDLVTQPGQPSRLEVGGGPDRRSIEWRHPHGYTWTSGPCTGHPVTSPEATIADTAQAIADTLTSG